MVLADPTDIGAALTTRLRLVVVVSSAHQIKPNAEAKLVATIRATTTMMATAGPRPRPGSSG